MGSLGEGYVHHQGCDHIFFIGFLGAGKSTLARNLGRLFCRGYVDTDRLVERNFGKCVCDIFEQDGEEAFRDAETEVLRSLKGRKSLLVSCGGGIVERPGNAQLMHEMGKVVYLDGDLEDSLKKIRHTEGRPDLGRCMKDTKACYERRRPLYEKTADYTLDIHNKSFQEVADAAAQLLWEKGLL